jgi:hypothetical protein
VPAYRQRNHRRVGELRGEDGAQQAAMLLGIAKRRFVEQQPGWGMQQQAREGQALLLVGGKLLVPALGVVEPRGEAVATDALQRG